MERRLAAILAADVVGYSRLMGEDEAGTLAALKAHREELIDPTIAHHNGRLVKLMGDGALVEFASAVSAVECAMALQEGMAQRSADEPEDRRIVFRIGVNIGDLIVEGDDLYGDGVNVAARLEGLAEPGGICVSRNVVDQVKGKVEFGFEDLGEQTVKNIAEPVQTFRVVPVSPAGPAVRPKAHSGRNRRPVLAAAGLMIAVLAGLVLWQRPWEPREEAASPEAMAFPLPDKPSIAVLPFTNMSGNPEQDYFADGMTDDLITDLSKVGGLFVIARNSTFVYKGRAVEIRQVAEDLGVRYVVEGSIRRADDTVRVNAQLIDATTGGHVWAERYDGEVDNIFAVQDDFVHKIVSALKITLVPQEDREIGRGQTDELVARESFQKGWELALRFNATDNAKAIPHLKQAIALDPNYGRAHAALTLAYLRATYLYWSTPLGMSREAAFYTGRETLKVAKENPTALLHVASTLFLLLDGPQEEAVAEAARAIELDPNEPEGHVVMAWALLTEGRTDEALQSIERAMRLNPNYPSHYVWTRGVAYFAEGEFERAATIFESQLEADPQAQELAALLASAYGILGRREEARAALKVWKPSWSPQTNITSVANFGLRFLRNSRFERVRERMYDGIYIAALPLEVTVSGLVESLEDENLFERLNALDVLSRFGPMAAPAIPALLIALDDEQELVRRRAIHALGKIGPAAIDAIPALEKLQGDRSVLGLEAKDAVRRILGT